MPTAAVPRWLGFTLAAFAAVALLLPPAAYWLVIGRAPSVPAEQALRELAGPGSAAVLVDVRPSADFRAEHLEGAVNWPLAEIRQEGTPRPRELTTIGSASRLFLLCPNGIVSAQAALRLRGLGFREAYSVQDGMCGWIGAATVSSARSPRLIDEAGRTRDLPAIRSPLAKQWLAVATGYLIKPVHMVLSLLLVIWLWRAGSPDLVALRWGLLSLLLGESACAANYLLFRHGCHLCEYLHASGMVIGFGLATYAAIEGIDRRVLHLGDPTRPCALLGLCRTCLKHEAAPCGARRVFLLLIPCVMVLSAMPLTAAPQMVSYGTTILGQPYNYSHPVVYQLFEWRFCPAYALLLLGSSFLALLLRPRDGIGWAKPLFAAGLGMAGFALLRFFIFRPYVTDLVWFQFWEEASEFLFVAAVGVLLWVFRGALFGADRSALAGRD